MALVQPNEADMLKENSSDVKRTADRGQNILLGVEYSANTKERQTFLVAVGDSRPEGASAGSEFLFIWSGKVF